MRSRSILGVTGILLALGVGAETVSYAATGHPLILGSATPPTRRRWSLGAATARLWPSALVTTLPRSG